MNMVILIASSINMKINTKHKHTKLRKKMFKSVHLTGVKTKKVSNVSKLKLFMGDIHMGAHAHTHTKMSHVYNYGKYLTLQSSPLCSFTHCSQLSL